MNTTIILIIIDLLISISAEIGSRTIDNCISEQLKQKGYVYIKPPRTKSEQTINNVQNFCLSLFVCWVPLINIVASIAFWFGSKEIVKECVKDSIKKGEWVKADEIEIENKENERAYLQERLRELRKFQKENCGRIEARSFSDFSVDERIAFLLRELEIAYEEKAKIEEESYQEQIDFCKEKTRGKILEFKNTEG